MSERGKELLRAVMELPDEERRWLTNELVYALEDMMTEEEFKEELRRRHDEYLRDPSCALPRSVINDVN